MAVQKANTEGLHHYLREQYDRFLTIDGGMDEIWKAFKNILDNALQTFVPCKFLKSNSDPEYYNAKIRRMKRKTRKAFNNRHRSETDRIHFRNCSKELEREKKIAQEIFLKHILDGEGNNWSGFYKYVRRRRGNKEEIPIVRDTKKHVTNR